MAYSFAVCKKAFIAYVILCIMIYNSNNKLVLLKLLIACKQALRMDYFAICFWIARGTQEMTTYNVPCMIWVLPLFCLTDRLPHVIAWLNENSHGCP